MAKTKISELDAAAANNTDINSVDVSEGCAPSGINNAIREMGAMLKRMDNGTDHLTNPNITGDLDVDNININGNTISSTDTNGNITLAPNGTGEVNLADSDKLTLGTGSDLELFHNGTNSIIEGKTGDLILRTAGTESIFLQDAGGNNLAQFNDNSDVKLYHNANQKLATTSTGIDVTGTSKSDLVIVDSTSGATPTYSHTNNGEGITLRYNDDSGARAADIVAIGNNPAGATMAMRFFVNPTSTDAASEVMRIQNGKVGINTTNPTLQTSVNFDSSALAGLGINDTNSGNLGGMLQFYSGSGQGTLRANIMNANNAGVHMAVGTGGSVVFTQNSYVAANALSDYEEGSFDPKVFQGGTEVGDAAYNSGFTGGQYTKIGRMCFITLSIRLTSKGTVTASNTFQIGNLPFVPIANVRARTAVSLFDHVGAGIDTSGNTNGTLMGLLTSSGTVSFRVSDVSGTTGEIIQFADIGDSLYLQLAFFFETS